MMHSRRTVVATISTAVLSGATGLSLLISTTHNASGLTFVGLSLVLIILLFVPPWEINQLQRESKNRPDFSILAFAAIMGIGGVAMAGFVFVRAMALGGLYLTFGVLGSLFFLAIGAFFITALLYAVRAPR